MRGERYQNTVAILLIVLAVASVPVLVNFPGLWWLWAPVVASLATLPAIFLREVDVLMGGRSPTEVRDALAAELGTANAAPVASAEVDTARLNAIASVRFRIRITEEGTVLSYQPWMTRAGWALLVALVLATVGSGVAIAAALALSWRVSKFAASMKIAVTRRLQAVSPPGTRDEVHALLMGGLSTSLRMVREAYEAQRKSYTDSRLTAGIAGFTIWFTLLIAVFVALNGFNLLTGQWEIPIAGATVTAVVLGVAFFLLLRRQFAPRLARYRDWTDRLGNAMGREMGPATEEPTRTDTFELLLRASEQVPDWLDAQRRAGISADPKTGFAILFLTAVTGSFLLNGTVQFLWGGGLVAAVYLSVAAALTALAVWIYRRWKRGEEARLHQTRANWDAHVVALRARMDRFLEEM